MDHEDSLATGTAWSQGAICKTMKSITWWQSVFSGHWSLYLTPIIQFLWTLLWNYISTRDEEKETEKPTKGGKKVQSHFLVNKQTNHNNYIRKQKRKKIKQESNKQSNEIIKVNK